MNRRDVLRKAGTGLAATLVASSTVSANDGGLDAETITIDGEEIDLEGKDVSPKPLAVECRDGCYEHCSDSGGCYCIC